MQFMRKTLFNYVLMLWLCPLGHISFYRTTNTKNKLHFYTKKFVFNGIY